MRLTGTVYNQTITARSMSDLKRKATLIANRRFRSYDIMEITEADSGIVFHLSRSNSKCPNNTITYGEWR